MSVLEIVHEYLKANKFDGLFSPGECACKLDDLAPCGEIHGDCEAGYLSDCDCGDHDWHIGPAKP